MDAQTRELQTDTDSSEIKEYLDCAVTAMSKFAGIPYKESHALFKAIGRLDKKSTPHWMTKKALAILGIPFVEINKWNDEYRDIINTYPGRHKKLRNITTYHPTRFPKVWADKPPILFHVNAHICAFVDGKIRDWAHKRQMQVIGLYIRAEGPMLKPFPIPTK